eukprot:scaffold967_cov173-Ochromonas_danica.AAC.30
MNIKQEIYPGTMIDLPLDIATPQLTLDSQRPPRLHHIYALNTSGSYAIGDDLYIALEFYSNLSVVGNPRIRFNTGCNGSSSCVTEEIQQFTCQAERGAFAIQLGETVLPTIYVNTSALGLKQKLETIPEITSVSVSITPGSNDSFDYNRLCSKTGNNVSVTFHRVNYPLLQGDVPTMLLSAVNGFVDDRTQLSLGADEVFLTNFNLSNHVYLSPAAVQVQQGVNRSDSYGDYFSGNNSNIIVFQYIVRLGDEASALDVVGWDWQEGYLSSVQGYNMTFVRLPEPGNSERYLSSFPSSLSFNTPIEVISASPAVINVTSLNASGLYTTGDRLVIVVQFNMAVSLEGMEGFTLELALGVFSRGVPFQSFVDETTLYFSYVVKPSDVSAALEVTSASALNLNGGQVYKVLYDGSILEANTVLPASGEVNSLSYNKKLVISTLSPVVISVTATPPSTDRGVYTVGDLVDLTVVYNANVTVYNHPRLIVKNEMVNTGVYIRTAPLSPLLSFTRGLPGEMTQVLLEWQFNFALKAGDQIELILPHLFVYPTREAKPIFNNNRSIEVSLFQEESDLLPDLLINVTGYWIEDKKSLSLTVHSSIGIYEKISLLVVVSNGLYIDTKGISKPFNDLYRVRRAGSNSDMVPYSTFLTNHAVGLEDHAVRIVPAAYDTVLTSLTVSVSFPEALAINDSITVQLVGFLSPSQNSATKNGRLNDLLHNITFHYNFDNGTQSVTLINYQSHPTVMNYSFNLASIHDWYLPLAGVSVDNVLLSAVMAWNGQVSATAINAIVPTICNFSNDTKANNVIYNATLGLVESAVTFVFSVFSNALSVGDQIIFTLPHLSTTSSEVAISAGSLSGEYKSYFKAARSGRQVIFTIISDISSLGDSQIVELTVGEEVGLTSPPGIVYSTDYFLFSIQSSSCQLASPRKIYYPKSNQLLFLNYLNFSIYSENGHLIGNEDLSYLGSNVGFWIVVEPAENLTFLAGDKIVFHLEDVERSITSQTIDNLNETIVSNIPLLRYEAYYNNRLSQLIITMTSRVSLSALTNDRLTFNITPTAAFYLPSSSIQSNSLTLDMVTSNSGSLYGQNLLSSGSFCLGICEVSLSASKQIVNVSTTVAVDFSFSAPLSNRTEIVLSLPYVLPVDGINSVSLSVSIGDNSLVRSISATVEESTISGISHTLFNITLESRYVAANSSITITCHGLAFQTNAFGDSNAKLSVLTSANFSSWIEVGYPQPIYSNLILGEATMHVLALEKYSISLQLPTDAYLPLNSQLIIYLPRFSWQQINNFSSNASYYINGGINSNLVNVNDCCDQDGKIVLDIVGTLSKGSWLSFTVNHLIPPRHGYIHATYSQNSSLSLPQYLVSYAILNQVGSEDSVFLAPYRPFNQVDDVIILSDVALNLTFGSSYGVSNMIFNVSITGGLMKNDVFTLSTPFLTASTPQSHSTIRVEMVSPVANATALFDISSKTLSITILNATSVENSIEHLDYTAYTFFFSPGNISLVNTGISGNEGNRSCRVALSRSANVLIVQPSINITLRCVGLCEADLIPLVPNPGRSTDFNLTFVVGGHGLPTQSMLLMTLNNFTANFKNTPLNIGKHWNGLLYHNIYNATCELSTAAGLQSALQAGFFFNKNTSSLLLLVLDGTSDSSSDLQVSCILPEKYGLIAPKAGVLEGTTYSTQLYIYDTGDNSYRIYENDDILTAGVIGGVLDSQLIISPVAADAPIDLLVHWQLADPLDAGDMIRVYLPGFKITNIYIPIFTSSCNVTATAYNASGSLSSTDFIINSETMVTYINFTIHNAVPAGYNISILVSNSFVHSPQDGLSAKSRLPYFTIYSSSAPVAGVDFTYVTKIAAQKNSALTIYHYSDEKGSTQNSHTLVYDNVYEHMSVEHYNNVYNLSIQAELNINCPLFANDSLIIYLPNIYYVGTSGNSENISVPHNLLSNSSSSVASSLWTVFNASSHNLTMHVLSGYIPSGSLTLNVNLTKHFIQSNEVVYSNNGDYWFTLASSFCVDTYQSTFSETLAQYVSLASISFLPPFYGAGWVNPVIQVDIVNTDIRRGDILVVELEHASYYKNGSLCHNNCTFRLANNTEGFFEDYGVVHLVNNNSLIITVTMKKNFTSAQLTLFTYYSENYRTGFRIDDVSAFNSNHSIQYKMVRPSRSNVANSLEQFDQVTLYNSSFFYGTITDVQDIIAFAYFDLNIANPVAGEVTKLSLAFLCHQSIAINDMIRIYLPGFDNLHTSTSKDSYQFLYISDDYRVQFNSTYHRATSMLEIVNLNEISADTVVTVELASSLEFVTPAQGIPFDGYNYSYAYFLAKDANSILWLNSSVDSITMVPKVSVSSIAYIDYQEDKAYLYSGNDHVLLLSHNHIFTLDDIDSLIVIEDQVYTIKDVDEEFLILYEPYVNQRVFLSDPSLYIFTPPYRFASYLDGNNSNTLVFQYRVGRDDKMNNITLAKGKNVEENVYLNVSVNINNLTYTNFYVVDYYDGSILRTSQSPTTAASIYLPAVDANNISIDTSAPRVMSIFTTSAGHHSYGQGEWIDIFVEFDKEVVFTNSANHVYGVNESILPPPRLMLDLYNSSFMNCAEAVYRSGSGTKHILFLYQVRAYDDVPVFTRELLEAYRDSQKPLHIITGNDPLYLKRKADIPHLLANVSIVDATFHVDDNSYNEDIAVYGEKVAQVVAVSVYNASSVYSAGDFVYIAVEYDQSVHISYLSNTINVSNTNYITVPYIWLDSGLTQPRIAFYHQILSDNRTLLFRYQLSVDDKEVGNVSIALHCTCQDYLQRTYIQLPGYQQTEADAYKLLYHNVYLVDEDNIYKVYHAFIAALENSTVANQTDPVVAIMTNGTNLPASLQLLNNTIYDVQASDYILYPVVVIDNQVPFITNVTVNLTDFHAIDTLYLVEDLTKFFASGDLLSISITFSAPVTVVGTVYLRLLGEESYLPAQAYYYDGNNSQTLSFIYPLHVLSGRSRIDFSQIASIETSFGKVYRQSEAPVIEVNYDLNGYLTPQHLYSLSRKYEIYIDNSAAEVLDVTFMGRHDADRSALEDVHILSTDNIAYNLLAPHELSIHPSGILAEVGQECDCEQFTVDDVQTLLTFVANNNFNDDFETSHVEYQVVNGNYSNSTLTTYNRWVVSQPNLQSVRNLPTNISTCLDWWKGRTVSNEMVVKLSFDRPVAIQTFGLVNASNHDAVYADISLTVQSTAEVSSNYNKAFATDRRLDYMLYLQSPTGEEMPNSRYFIITYNGILSSCIPLTISASGLTTILRNMRQLSAFEPEVTWVNYDRTIVVTAENIYMNSTLYRNVNIYKISFSYLPDYPIDLLEESDARNDQLCGKPLVDDQKAYLQKKTKDINFVYDVVQDNMLVFQTRAEQAMSSHFMFTIRNLPLKSSALNGISPHSVLGYYYDMYERKVATMRINPQGLARKVIYSSVHYSNAKEVSRLGSLKISICFNLPLEEGDRISIYLPHFETTNTQDVNLSALYYNMINSVASPLGVYYYAVHSRLNITIPQSVNMNSSCVHMTPRYTSNETLVQPEEIVFLPKFNPRGKNHNYLTTNLNDQNSPLQRTKNLFGTTNHSSTYLADYFSPFHLDLYPSDVIEWAVLENQLFDYVSPRYLEYCEVYLSDSRPYYSTNITIAFRLVDNIPANEAWQLDLYLPAFYVQNFNNESYPNKRDYVHYLNHINNNDVNLTVIGEYFGDIEAEWSNQTNILRLTMLSAFQSDYDYAVTISAHPTAHWVMTAAGTSPTNPLTVAVSLNGTSQTNPTTVSNFPLVIGYDRSFTYLTLGVTTNLTEIKSRVNPLYLHTVATSADISNNDINAICLVRNITLSVALTSDVKGPVYVTLYLPILLNTFPNRVNPIEQSNYKVTNNGEVLTDMGSMSWFEHNSSFVLFMKDNLTNGALEITLYELSNFIVDNAIPLLEDLSIYDNDDFVAVRDKYIRVYINTSVYLNDSWNYFAIQGQHSALGPSPVFYQNTPLLKQILYSKVSFQHLSNDIFYSGNNESMRLVLKLNHQPDLDDLFDVKITSGLLFNTSQATIDNNCFYLTNQDISAPTSYFSIGLTNATKCTYYYNNLKSIKLTINGLVIANNANVEDQQKFVRQLRLDPYVFIRWKNEQIATNYQAVKVLPPLGIVSSRLSLDNNRHNAETPFTFQVLTATTLYARDQIVLTLPKEAVVPWINGSTASSSYVYDQTGRIWQLQGQAVGGTISLYFIVPTELVPSAITFSAEESSPVVTNTINLYNSINSAVGSNAINNSAALKVIISSRGIVNAETDNITVTLGRYQMSNNVPAVLFLHSQALTYASPVASLEDVDVYFTRNNSQLNATVLLSFREDYRFHYNDRIYLTLSNLKCVSGGRRRLFFSDELSYESYCLENNLILIRILQGSPPTAIYDNQKWEFQLAGDDEIWQLRDDVLCVNCVVTASIDSATLPISSTTFSLPPSAILMANRSSLEWMFYSEFLPSDHHSTAQQEEIVRSVERSLASSSLNNHSLLVMTWNLTFHDIVPNNTKISLLDLLAWLPSSVPLDMIMVLGMDGVYNSSSLADALTVEMVNSSLSVTFHQELNLTTHAISFLFNTTSGIIPIIYEHSQRPMEYLVEQTLNMNGNGSTTTDAGVLDNLSPFGLSSSRLSYMSSLTSDSVYDGVHAAGEGEDVFLSLTFEAQDFFKQGDILSVHLPNYTVSGALTMAAAIGSGGLPINLTASWSSDESILSITFPNQLYAAVNVKIGPFQLPSSLGYNDLFNTAKISYNATSTNHRIGHFGPSPFLFLQQVPPATRATVQFAEYVAGLPSGIELTFTALYHNHPAGSVIDIYLPSFGWDYARRGTSNYGLNLRSNFQAHALEATWDPSSFVVHILVKEDVLLGLHVRPQNDTEWVISIQGLTLPVLGVSDDLIQAINITSTSPYWPPFFSVNKLSSSYGIHPLEGFERNLQVHRVGYFTNTSLSFSSNRLEEKQTVSVEFFYSEAIHAGQWLLLKLGNSKVYPHLCSFSNETNMGFVLNATASQNASLGSVLWIQSSGEILRQLLVKIEITNCLEINFDINNYKDFNSLEVLPVDHSVFSGGLSKVWLTSETQFGIKHAKVFYEVVDSLQAISMRIELDLGSDMQVGDYILLHLPRLYSLSNRTETISFHGSSYVILEGVYGDSMGDAFALPFQLAFDGSHGNLLFLTSKSVEKRKMNVYLTSSNGLYLNTSTALAEEKHSVSYNFNATGLINNQTVEYSPLSYFSKFVDVVVDFSRCQSYDASYQMTFESNIDDQLHCDMEISFSLTGDLQVGEAFAIAHSAFYYDPKFTIVSTNQSQQLAGSASSDSHDPLTVFVNGNESWNVFYRPEDGNNDVRIVSDITYSNTIAGHAIYVDALHPNVLASQQVASKDDILYNNKLSVAQDTIGIVNIYLAEDTLLPLLCGETIYIVVSFSAPILTASSTLSSLKLLLNTNEYASYSHTNDIGDQLVFRYNLDSPLTVPTLKVLGPSALEFSGQLYVASSPNQAVNLTIPSMFLNEFYIQNYADNYADERLLQVDCSDNDLAIVSIYVNENNITHEKVYSAGDAVDIYVFFNRDIHVVNQPYMPLLIGDQRRLASYVNVSGTQYITISTSGYLALSYQGEVTQCFYLSSDSHNLSVVQNVLALETALSQLSQLFPATPVQIEKVAHDNAILYAMTFKGLAPFVINVDYDACNNIFSIAQVSIENSLTNAMIFRLYLTADDPTGLLSYYNNTHIVANGSNAIYTPTTWTVNINNQYVLSLALPANASANSLFAQHVLVDNTIPRIVNITMTINGDRSISRPAVSGEKIYIELTYNYPVTLLADGGDEIVDTDVALPLAITNLLDLYDIHQDNSTYQLAFLHSHVAEVLIFVYTVKQGDVATFSTGLSFASSHEVLLLNSSYRLWKASKDPIILANLTLPATAITHAIAINATDVPIITQVYAQPDSNPVTAGQNVTIFIEFSSIVQIYYDSYHNYSLPETVSTTPYVNLTTPSHSLMYYIDGNGSNRLSFLLSVLPQQESGNVSFYFHLHRAFLRDPLGHEFTFIDNPYYYDLLYTVSNFTIDTRVPTVWKVDCNCSDGMYYPGQSLDLYLSFDKAVQIIPLKSNSINRKIALGLFLPTTEKAHLAFYSYGNGTQKLHFKYIIPAPNPMVLPQAFMQLDYTGLAAVTLEIEGFELTDVSPYPLTIATGRLPTLDFSYLAFHRSVFIDFTVAMVKSVYQVNASDFSQAVSSRQVVTLGDQIYIAVEYTLAVMFFKPSPYLILQVASNRNSTANYVSGNGTQRLIYCYTIQLGDATKDLDYVDTRYSPYNTVDGSYSYPLVAYDDYLKAVYLNWLNGLYMMSEDVLIPVVSAMPLPGKQNSLSWNSDIVIDTAIPRITNVTALVSNGSYDAQIDLIVKLSFSTPVVIYGCSSLMFMIQSKERYATYYKGNGSAIIYYVFTIAYNDNVSNWDYYDTFSFRLASCQGNILDSVSIKRRASIPTLIADLSLPPVNVVPTIISPRSILGHGIHVTLTAMSNAYIQSIGGGNSAYSGNDHVLTMGDVCDVNLTFTSSVQVVDPTTKLALAFFTYDTLEYFAENNNAYDAIINNDDARELLYGFASYSGQPEPDVVRFQVVILTDDEDVVDDDYILSYDGPFAVETYSSCGIIDQQTKGCAAQNLPYLLNMFSASNTISSPGQDLLTRNNLTIRPFSKRIPRLVDAVTLPSSNDPIKTGQKLTIYLVYDRAVSVIGTPQIILRCLSTLSSTIPVVADFSYAVNETTLAFEYYFVNKQLEYCEIDKNSQLAVVKGVNGLYQQSSWIPFISASTSLIPVQKKSSNLSEDAIAFHAVSAQVRRVYSNLPDFSVWAKGDEIGLFVEFTEAVEVILADNSSTLCLYLELPRESNENAACAKYVAMVDTHTLYFIYEVQATDYTSALDYEGRHSLVYLSSTTSNSLPFEGGVYLASPGVFIPADLTLPRKGSSGSLARQSVLQIDQLRPNLVHLYAGESAYSCGERIKIYVVYDTAVKIVWNDKGKGIQLSLLLTSSSYNTVETLYASYSHQEDENQALVFYYALSSSDPYGTITLTGPNALLLNTNLIVGASTLLSVSSVLSSSVVSNFSLTATSTTNSPYVTSIYSLNSTTRSRPFTVGDELYFVVKFSANILISNTSAIELELQLDSGIREAKFLTYYENILKLFYIIQEGDMAERLNYASTLALHGTIYADNLCDQLIEADTTLPDIDSRSSLYYSGISIDTTPPYVTLMMPLKVADSYGLNEELLILVRFDRSVIVQGEPQLALRTKTTNQLSPHYASYVNYESLLTSGKVVTSNLEELLFVNGSRTTRLYTDINIVFSDTDVLFRYLIEEDDTIANVMHYSTAAMVVGNRTDRILAYSSHPNVVANTALRTPGDYDTESGTLYQQWLFGFATKVDFLVRGLSLSSLEGIKVDLYHEDVRASVIANCQELGPCGRSYTLAYNPQSNLRFMDDSSRPLGRPSREINPRNERGLDEDVLFSDTEAYNLALLASITQSSTVLPASNVIDGRISSLRSQNSTSETTAEEEPWLLAELNERSQVESVVIFERLPEVWIEPIIDLTIKAAGQEPKGYFKLKLSNMESSGK